MKLIVIDIPKRSHDVHTARLNLVSLCIVTVVAAAVCVLPACATRRHTRNALRAFMAIKPSMHCTPAFLRAPCLDAYVAHDVTHTCTRRFVFSCIMFDAAVVCHHALIHTR